jgi:hypothetical protein
MSSRGVGEEVDSVELLYEFDSTNNPEFQKLLNVKVRVTTSTIDGQIIQISTIPYGKISESIMDTQQSQTHKALIKLGWTPPPSINDKESNS